ncbi:uncharacterized protein TRIVIDRAFT_186937 [Trichoderma virens Gv29-8]|uniref:Uncharacterized protein n=1 Tax=Hypocrea virens (strain Gv29-8 / FGSC 10586) TaxID=413071 RepID=G9N1N6_HYPVG|nr:uncharacterized protein TRIVIDRAFT_186937 [Trichoderma virens Gv29-8]EHK19664.1 hypothetical protein TRIVIDRAFT_213636 [Trichoderma virens Gv29-8]
MLYATLTQRKFLARKTRRAEALGAFLSIGRPGEGGLIYGPCLTGEDAGQPGVGGIIH